VQMIFVSGNLICSAPGPHFSGMRCRKIDRRRGALGYVAQYAK
jgi:hypothetical protein